MSVESISENFGEHNLEVTFWLSLSRKP